MLFSNSLPKSQSNFPNIVVPNYTSEAFSFTSIPFRGEEDFLEPIRTPISCPLDGAEQIRNFLPEKNKDLAWVVPNWQHLIEISGESYTILFDVPPQHVLPVYYDTSSDITGFGQLTVTPAAFLWKIPNTAKEITLKFTRPKNVLPYSGLFVFFLVKEDLSGPAEVETINIEVDGAFTPRIVFLFPEVDS